MGKEGTYEASDLKCQTLSVYFGEKGGQDSMVLQVKTPSGSWDKNVCDVFTLNEIDPVYGCTDSAADNYDSSATVDDDSCHYSVRRCGMKQQRYSQYYDDNFNFFDNAIKTGEE